MHLNSNSLWKRLVAHLSRAGERAGLETNLSLCSWGTCVGVRSPLDEHAVRASRHPRQALWIGARTRLPSDDVPREG